MSCFWNLFLRFITTHTKRNYRKWDLQLPKWRKQTEFLLVIFLIEKMKERSICSWNTESCMITDLSSWDMHAWMLSSFVAFNSLWFHGLYSARFLCPWDCPGKQTGVDCQSFLQGIVLMQGLNQSLLHWQVNSLPLNIYLDLSQCKGTKVELVPFVG